MKNLGRLLSIEGNIGSGKSTLLKLIQHKFPQTLSIDEPLQDWVNSNLLTLYYQDPQRWAFTFQTYCLFSRIKSINHFSFPQGQVFVSERSIDADKEVFAKLLRQKGYINDTEWNLYESYFDGYQEQLEPKKVDMFVYLRTNPAVCFERMKKRARAAEKVVPLEYLKELHERHEEWLLEHPRAIVLNGDKEF